MSDEATERALIAEHDQRDEELSLCMDCGAQLADDEVVVCEQCWNEMPL